MRDTPTKADNVGDTLPAANFNAINDELENLITTTGQTLDPNGGPDTDLYMIAQAITAYAAGGWSYVDSGAADAYVLGMSTTLKPIKAYRDDMVIVFKAGNTNTGASTVNVATLGAKNITLPDGTALSAGAITAGNYIIAIYNLADDRFELVWNGLYFPAPILDKASPGAIGGTTPAAGSFTDVDVDTLVAGSATRQGRIDSNDGTGSGATVDSTSDDIVINGSANSGMSILSGSSSLGQVLFGDSGDSNRGRVSYDHSADQMELWAVGEEILQLGIDGGEKTIRIQDTTVNSSPSYSLANDAQGWKMRLDGSSDIFAILDTSYSIGALVVYPSTGDIDLYHDLSVGGTLSKGAGTFKIDHPLDPENKTLFHGFVESPRYDLIYRGTTKLKNGKAKVSIDATNRMMIGTFEALTQNPQVMDVQCSDFGNWDRFKAKVVGGDIEIISDNKSSDAEVSWCVIAERADAFIKSAEGTDENGYLLTEVDKPEPTTKDLSALDDAVEVVDIAHDADDREDEVGDQLAQSLIGKKGFMLHPEAHGKKHPTRKVTKKFSKEKSLAKKKIFDEHVAKIKKAADAKIKEVAKRAKVKK